MRQLLEDALITYLQEEASFFTIIAPALLMGPVFVLIATTGLIPMLATLPVLVLTYLACYAACVRAGGFMLRNLAPSPKDAYLDILARGPDLLRMSGPAILLAIGITACVLFINDRGQPLLALAEAGAGAATFLYWATRHAYDQPSVLAQRSEGRDTADMSRPVAEGGGAWTAFLLLALFAPLAVAAAASWGLGMAVTPAFGGAVFALVIAVWLPLPALTLTSASERLTGSAG